MLGKLELETFYAENFGQLVKRTASRCGSPFDAEDIVQTAFEKALKYGATYTEGTHLDRWFSVILNNTLRDHQSAIRLGPVTKPLEEHLDDIEPIIPNDILPVVREDIWRMAKQEGEPNATVLRLHLGFGFTCGEINDLVEGLTYRKINGIIWNFQQKVIKRYQ